jgi:two-component system cell cycle sensor histidine kinase/response regulator CckA
MMVLERSPPPLAVDEAMVRLSTVKSLAVVALLMVMPLRAAEQAQQVVIGTNGGQLSGIGPGSYDVLSDYLADSISGYRFEIRSFDTIADLVSAIEARTLDFAFLTPAAYVEIELNHELRTLATVTQEVDGSVYPWLASAVFTLDDDLHPVTLEDVEGRSVVALARLAVGGWLAALREWRLLGIDVESRVSRLEFLFSFEQLLQRVCSGEVDIGVLSAQVFHRMRKDCPQPLRVLTNPLLPPDSAYPAEHSSRLYPELAFVALGRDNSEALVIDMTKALLSIETGSAPALAASVAGFTAPLSYEPVKALMQELRIGPFADFGQFSFIEFLRQHSGKVSGVLLAFLGLLGLGFARSQRLNLRLQQSEKFRRLLFEKSTLPVAIVDSDNFRFVDLNQAAVAMYGYGQAEEIIGKTPLDVSAPQQKDGRVSAEIIRAVAAAHAEPGAGSFEWLHSRPDGTLWEADIHLLAIDFSGQRLLQATMVDVTERNRIRAESERLSQQLHHAQRLESLGRLSGAIAHDFNNLLTVINGYSELLLLSMDKQSRDYRTMLEIAQAGWRARNLTNQLLTFGRRQIGSVRPMDVNATILDATNMFRSLLGDKIRLHTTLETDPGLVLADAGQLGQVLMNLIANARDAMPDGGSCFITTIRKEVRTEEATALGIEPGDCMLISITDTGTGMSSDTQAHVFEPFFSTKGEKGNGIGLATAYGIIRQCGGAINFLSQQDHGTTFSIYLPLTTRELQAGSNETLEQGDLRASAPWQVLVVEDQPDVRLYACSVLRSAGYKVLEAESGEKALELARSARGAIDLLFTDVVMPGMNGRELAERFALQWPGIHILFTSGYADDEVALHGVVQDRIQFIAKPYVPQHLLSKVKTTLAQEGLRLP